ncbi:MAG TPA: hypothetical protein VIM11_05435 [Tepidisphaeraceae bacterium]|jgi:uncharacterized integral membrane protein
MANLWLKFRIWTKVAVIAALVIYVILFTYNNAQPKVELWYWFGHKPQTNLLLLALCSFLAGVVGTVLARTTLRTVRQVQDLQDRARSQRMDREMADIRTKAAMLQTKTMPVAAPAPPAKHVQSPIEQLEDRTQM